MTEHDRFVQELIAELRASGDASAIAVEKQDERYKITVVSTAAIEDREGETFTTQAIDYDIAEAYRLKDFPEFRVFHSPLLGIGKVEKMSRVGIFAIDEGFSYTDDFSISVCEKMLVNNDGRWRASRGFRAYEVNAHCPLCRSSLEVNHKHMVAGFRCPTCFQVHLSFKGMQSVRYTKARTFDVTVTDVPAVPMTSASAVRTIQEVSNMNKEQLKERLLAEGFDEAIVDARLANVSENQLKELTEIPQAILKELEAAQDIADVFYLDEGAISAITDSVAARVGHVLKETLEDFELELGDVDMDVEFKEIPDLIQLKEQVAELREMVERLLQDDDTRLKEYAPRNAVNRLRVYKGSGKKAPPAEEMDDEEDEEEEEGTSQNGTPIKKSTERFFRHFKQQALPEEPIVDGEGNTYGTLSEMIGQL